MLAKNYHSITIKCSNLYGSARLGSLQVDKTIDEIKNDGYGNLLGSKRYEITNHLGNVQAVISDNRTTVTSNGFTYYKPDIVQTQDYYPFGMRMPGMYGPLNSTYKFGFNGQEKTDEIAGYGNHNTALFWEYDTRTARRWNLDPKPQVSISDYATFANNPIWFSDPLGDIIDPTTTGYNEAHEAATPKYNKKGKQTNNAYEPEFEKLFQEWENNEDIIVKFVYRTGDDGGTINFEGISDDGKKIYNIFWDPDLKDKLGTSALFEEAFHFKEALEGLHLEFVNIPNKGVKYLDINDEIRAKLWVARNIKINKLYFEESSIKDQFGSPKKHSFYTHYGYILKLNNQEDIKKYLRTGVTFSSTIVPEIGSFGDEETKTSFFKKYSNQFLFPDGNVDNPNYKK